MDTTTPAPQVWPTLQAKDARGLIDYLVRVFGFEETVVHPNDDGTIAHAQLDWPEGGGIMLGSHKPEGPFTLEPGTFSAYVVSADVEGLHRRAADAGGIDLSELTRTDYGSTDFRASDPEGNTWTFGTYPGEPRKG
ncbi:VOC family protein [Tersicoccus sp. MR15.9]|uniref:VOC family protein n=1 Tax=Tersicoccus mangrovi TaxID=3121635 RepID=UPI002FE56234